MPKFAKEVIRPGVYNVGGRTIKVTPEDIQHWVELHEEMQAKGLRVPVPWEHPEHMSEEGKPADAERQRRRMQSKLNAGWAEKMYVGEDGSLMAILDIPLEEDAAKIGETVKAVSPEFGGVWQDYEGRTWDNPITHIALTPRPVNPQQGAFIRMSLADYVEPLPAAADTQHMSQESNDVDDEKDTKDTKEETPTETPNVRKRLLEAFKGMGIVVAETDTEGDEFLEHLLTAVLTHKASKGEGESETSDEGEDEEIKQEKGEVVNMSHADTVKLSQLEAEIQSLKRERFDRTLADTKAEIARHVNRGAMTPAIGRKMADSLSSVQFSAAGESAVSEVQRDLKVYRDIPDNQAFPVGPAKPHQMSLQPPETKEHAQGDFFTQADPSGRLDPKRAEEVVNEQLRIKKPVTA